MKSFLVVLGFILTLFSFLPLIKSPKWWIRVLDFPRLQVAVLLTAILIAFVVMFGIHGAAETAMVVLWALAILNEVRFIVHFTPLVKVTALRTEQKVPQDAFTLMIANVRMANTKYQAFLDLALQQDPDMLVMNEPGEEWYKNVRQELSRRYPYAIKKPLNNTYGMLLWSKFKLEETEIRFLVEDGIPSFYATVVLPSGNRFGMYTVHPQPPQFMKNTETRGAELLLVAKQAKENPLPCVVAGDLNDVAWSKTTKLFKEISTMIDPRVGRGFYNTYNAFVPLFRYPLDHVFYSPAFRLVHLRRLPKFGSDHFPITITLNFEPQKEDKQEHPVADRADKQEAREMIAEGLEKGEERDAEKLHGKPQ
ncbi:endonuclease/exonuclease/phosphatase family protein [Pontibacter sp. 172403-2]|uniref:endonuclease/exonuclease/phosphatase family protein n=1 Tax=Pontibacter rufus TaxID=2791028 RepID=UPI0018AFAFEB|nr:endonuclease/exonuclease/phosphatase family protein [Pontibacter sp. 172403-2]MBF9253253.1 endonuclease/exonuclease/phosphatase family protein [Pontibacter sp. 172403-2]